MREHLTPHDWRDRENYHYPDDLVRADWAWEALRRNPAFKQNWRQARGAFEIVEESKHLRVFRAPKDNTALEEWGCVFCDPPESTANDAVVLWRPELYARILPMEARPQTDAIATTLFRLREMRCNVTLVVTDYGVQHVFVRDGGHGFQLAVHGRDLLRPVHLVADAVLDPKKAAIRLKLLQCFNDLRATGHLVPSHYPAERATPRLRRVMQALDGALAGASYREIAEVLFGKTRTESEWHGSNSHLRDHVRRAVKRGEMLMNGGYRSFLR